jgi:hypothetical protein
MGGRNRIRELKRDYVKAVMEGKSDKAKRIDGEFIKLFPPLKSIRKLIKESDFEMYHKRLQVTRLEQLMDTLPPEIRPVYAQALQAALVGVGPEVLGLEEGTLTSRAGTALQREPRRVYGKFRGHQTPRGSYREQMGPLGNPSQNDVSYRGSLGGFDQFASFDLAP